MRYPLVFGVAFLAIAPFWSGCNCASNGGGNHPDGFQGGPDAGMGLDVTPPEVTVDVNAGGPPATTQLTATTTADGKDVTSQSEWLLDDPTLGSIAAGLFTSNITKGGTTIAHAMYQGLSGAATIHVKLHATLSGGCPSCPTFPDPPSTSCGAATAPTLVYPPDGVLLPPNMNVMEVQFIPGTGTQFYEVDFENTVTDIRVTTLCNAISDTRGAATGGCSFDLDPTVWGYLANSNRGGDPVKVSVRATTDGSCASPSADRNISFANQDLNGGLYYWQSLVVGGVAGKTGGIYRYDFGAAGTTGTAFLTPTSGSCVGCHFLSRDGQRMTYGTDDADSDDEYGDLSGHLIDVGTKTLITTTTPGLTKPLPPGFQTFTHDHSKVMASTGQANNDFFNYWDGNAGGAPLGQANTGTNRGTQPDWGPDDLSIVYVVPTKYANQFAPNPYSRLDDDHFLGGSLMTISYDPASGMFGMPQPLITSMGENNFYPSYSPDTPPSWVAFNRADDPALTTDLSKDAFNNPYARVFIVSTKAGATPIDLTNLNADPQSTNSWPRWSPFVQQYQGQQLLWITFSSTRDYGLRVRNHVKVDDGTGTQVDQINCYPPDSPQNLTGSHQQPLPPNCNQPQIWMAAINLSTAEFNMDPSFPAFWLPFQDVTAHNHIAQWTETVVTAPMCGDGGTPPDGGACIADQQPCGGNICGVCCDGELCFGGVCSHPIP